MSYGTLTVKCLSLAGNNVYGFTTKISSTHLSDPWTYRSIPKNQHDDFSLWLPHDSGFFFFFFTGIISFSESLTSENYFPQKINTSRPVCDCPPKYVYMHGSLPCPTSWKPQRNYRSTCVDTMYPKNDTTKCNWKGKLLFCLSNLNYLSEIKRSFIQK